MAILFLKHSHITVFREKLNSLIIFSLKLWTRYGVSLIFLVSSFIISKWAMYHLLGIRKIPEPRYFALSFIPGLACVLFNCLNNSLFVISRYTFFWCRTFILFLNFFYLNSCVDLFFIFWLLGKFRSFSMLFFITIIIFKASGPLCCSKEVIVLHI